MNELVTLLQQNARLSNEQLAVMLGKTTQEVTDEIHALEAQGVIKGYSAIVNKDLVDSDRVTAIIELKVTPQKDRGFEEMAKTIAGYEEVESVSLMAGAYDLAVTVNGNNVKEIAMFVSQRLAPLGGVLSTATHFILRRYKEMGIIINDEEKDEREYICP